jgi:hypothetical protein
MTPGIKIPKELERVSQAVLEKYVREHLCEFGKDIVSHCKGGQDVDTAVAHLTLQQAAAQPNVRISPAISFTHRCGQVKGEQCSIVH